MSLWGHVSASPNWFQEVKSCVVNGLIAREIVYWMEGLIWFVVIFSTCIQQHAQPTQFWASDAQKGHIAHFSTPNILTCFRT
jgi:hypothetical protein